MLKDLIMSMLLWMSEGLIFAKVMLIFSFHVYIAMMIFFGTRRVSPNHYYSFILP